MVGATGELAGMTTAGVLPAPATADLKALGRGSSLNFLGALVSGTAGVATAVVVARTQSTEASGVFFVVTSLLLIVSGFTKLGSGLGSVYFVARLRALGRWDLLPACLRTATRPVLVVSTVAALALLALAEPLGHLLAADQAAAVTRALWTVALLLPFASVLDVVLGASRGLGSMRSTFAIEKCARPLLQLVLVAGACFWAEDLLALAWTLPWLPAVLLAWPALGKAGQRASERGRRPGGSRLQPSSAAGAAEAVEVVPGGGQEWSSRGYWRFCAPRALTAVMQTALLRLDILLVAGMAGPREAAVYTAATRFLVVGQLVNQSVSLAVAPQLAAVLATRNGAEANVLYRMSTAWLILAVWPIYLFCALQSPFIMGIFGRNYDDGRPVVVLLSLVMLIAIACGLTDVLLNMAGRASWNVYNRGLALGVNVAVDLVLIPRMGILGAAVGWSAAILISNLVPLVQLVRHLQLSPWGSATWRAALVAGVGCGLVPLVARLVLGSSAPAQVAALGLGLLVYAALTWRWRGLLQLDDLTASVRRRRRPAAI